RGCALRRRQGGSPRAGERHRGRRRRTRDPCEHHAPVGSSRMVTETVGDRPQAPEEWSFLHAIDPELVVPLVVFLASPPCELSHHNYSACAGRYARVFVGLGEGWVAKPGSNPSADDVEAHLAEISRTDPFTVPMSIFDEVADICTRLGITS